MKKRIIDKIIESGRGAAVVAGVGYGASKLVDSVSRVSEKDPKTIKKFGGVSVGIASLIAVVTGVIIWCKKRCDGKKYGKERNADADLYERQKLAEADLYVIQKQADEREIRTKAECGVYRKPRADISENNAESVYSDDEIDSPEFSQRIPWIESWKARFTMPTLPPFLQKIFRGVPEGYEDAMLLHTLSMLGAMCFSKVRAKYLDQTIHAANLQIIVEGNWGAGKAKFEQIFKSLFNRVLERDMEKIENMDEKGDYGDIIVQTTGIGTSMARYVDILANNQGCHSYLFNSEVRALFYDLKKPNGMNFDFLRKAFENGDVCRNNRSRDSKNGIFPIFLNYTITGTPVDINTTFKKELEGGTLSRIGWSCIPEAGRYPGVLRMPEGAELEAIRNQIDEWANTYCYTTDGEEDEAVEEVHIDLDYVCKALASWNDRQYEQSVTEGNPARKDVRMRMAAIAFHCAIVLHMLYGSPSAHEYAKRNQVIDLTLYIANYCMERFLHKFGAMQNEQRKQNQEDELVNTSSLENAIAPEQPSQRLIKDVKELKRLHDILDEKGNHKYGWDKLVELSGLSKSKVRRKVGEYEAALAIQQ